MRRTKQLMYYGGEESDGDEWEQVLSYLEEEQELANDEGDDELDKEENEVDKVENKRKRGKRKQDNTTNKSKASGQNTVYPKKQTTKKRANKEEMKNVELGNNDMNDNYYIDDENIVIVFE